MLPRKDLAKAKAVGEEMTRITGLYIEDNIYTKMVLRDVNNYLSVYENGDVKLKGCFEIDKEFHKDPSMRIVPIALKEYFVNGIPISQTIRNHTDIFDFCMRLKTKSDSTGIFQYLNNEGYKTEKQLDRTTRYYMSRMKDSGILLKRFNDGRETGVNIGFSSVIFNEFIEKPINEYKIDYDFYIKEANKVKDAIVDKQLYLF